MSSFLEKWSTYVSSWRKSNGYSRKQFSQEAHIDPRLLRDIEDRHFNSRFYSIASSAEYIRHQNLRKQLCDMHVEDPDIYLPLIDTLDFIPPTKRNIYQVHFIEYFRLLKYRFELDRKLPKK